jgi:hypothetical protein
MLWRQGKKGRRHRPRCTLDHARAVAVLDVYDPATEQRAPDRRTG